MANLQRSVLVDAGFRHLTRLFAFFVFMLLAGILASLIYGSRESLVAHGVSFLWTNDWDPVKQSFGALVPMLGTVISAFLALLIAVPMCLGLAMFLSELAPVCLRRPLGVASEMLAAIPSVIYDIWGVFVVGP